MDLVITTIFPPTKGAQVMSDGLAKHGGTLWVIGDAPGPESYDLPHVKFFSLADQLKLKFRLSNTLPQRHYSRKNLGYLCAIKNGAREIVETDDDNIPVEGFWDARESRLTVDEAAKTGWHNAYTHFVKPGEQGPPPVWPRGFPLEAILDSTQPAATKNAERDCLILQGLADDNPDVDAVYRMTRELPITFEKSTRPVALPRNCWCPFNSQNTIHFEAALPLLYLPSHCSFRMTDIWRSFVAQRCLWEMDASLAFTNATVYQERNEHNLLRDFEQEVPGYLQNDRIRQTLEDTVLKNGRDAETVADNLIACYMALVEKGIMPKDELPLLDSWRADLLSVLV